MVGAHGISVRYADARNCSEPQAGRVRGRNLAASGLTPDNRAQTQTVETVHVVNTSLNAGERLPMWVYKLVFANGAIGVFEPSGVATYYPQMVPSVPDPSQLKLYQGGMRDYPGNVPGYCQVWIVNRNGAAVTDPEIEDANPL
eukprot:1869103-Amphidinium_carterae.1